MSINIEKKIVTWNYEIIVMKENKYRTKDAYIPCTENIFIITHAFSIFVIMSTIHGIII